MPQVAPILLDWYAHNGRDLPWRRTRDAYRIWISEVILQQTRVAQGQGYYERFVERFPDVQSLAAAPQDEVMKLWQGLGYYSRARNLHTAAMQVVQHFGGVFPATYEQVRTLKGVGEYTAAAICSAAYDLPHAVVDGNVGRVLSRLFDLEVPIDTAAGHKALATLAQSQMDVRQAGRYNQAIMDFGALHCTPMQPACDDCPFCDACLALAADTVAQRPVKRARTAVRDRWFHYLHITCGGETFIRRREGRDIWQGLYEFPLIETPQSVDLAGLAALPEFASWVGPQWHLQCSVMLPHHQLSHQTIHAVFHRLDIPMPGARLSECIRVPEASLGDYAVARLTERYLSR